MGTIRFLQDSEKNMTRELYKEAFYEDSESFIDYYYSEKTADNRIIAYLEDDKVMSMIQLNPYRFCTDNNVFDTYYIVAVATRIEARKRGLMGANIRYMYEHLYREKCPFVYLMPAAKEIYEPYDFTYIYDKKSAEYVVSNKKSDRYSFYKVNEEDIEDVLEFYNNTVHIKNHTLRDYAYYKRLIKELESDGGSIIKVICEGKILCVFNYCPLEGEIYVTEIILASSDIEGILSSYFEDNMKVTVTGIYADGEYEMKPSIMARIINLDEMINIFTFNLDCEYIEVVDKLITANCGYYRYDATEGRLIKSVREDRIYKTYNIAELTATMCSYGENLAYINEIV